MRIAMWSGPRNLSTAMMYSFGARTDCTVTDEPFYAAYLAQTGYDHPMRTEILASQDNDAAKVAAMCGGANPEEAPYWYQKHMCHHMLPSFDRGFLSACTNVFLIRHPARVIASYHAKHENPSLRDIAFLEQEQLFDQVASEIGRAPIVVDSADIRENPERMLISLCKAIGIAFDPRMLSWPAGGHKDDGVWAEHWYPAVWQSTGFAGTEGDLPTVPDTLQPVLEQALPIYEKLRAFAIS